jgi:hypothetical protein
MPANSKTSKPSTKETPAPVEAKAETKSKKVTKVEAVAPAPVAQPTQVTEAAPQKGAGKAKTTSQKGSGKVEATPAKVEAAAPATKVEAVATTKTATKAKATKTEAKAAPTQKAGAAKAKATPKAKAAEKPAKQPKAAKKVEAEGDEEGDDSEKGVRSFKVQLPGNEEFTGRFTGLTPYQAANKALSKYFRENKTAKTEISFSIRESTRGSKRSTYTYNGKREKLATPVKYSIKGPDGAAREIVKEYKNKLTKVKKSETKEATA